MGFDAYPQFQLTFAAQTSGLTPVAACTDIGSIRTDGTKLIRLRQVIVTGFATANDSIPVIIVKRTTLNTGSTLGAITAVPFDSSHPASTATVVSYGTTNPTLGSTTGGGSLVGNRLILAKATGSGGSGDAGMTFYFGGKSDFMRAPSILNATEQLCINLGGGTVPGGASIDFAIIWTEEPLP